MIASEGGEGRIENRQQKDRSHKQLHSQEEGKLLFRSMLLSLEDGK